MTLAWREHDDAHDELRAAAEWYEAERAGLGDELLDAVDAVIGFILDWPNAAPTFHGYENAPPVRTKGVQDFPYRLVYVVRDQEVIVLAYAHEKRRPGYWKHRIEN